MKKISIILSFMLSGLAVYSQTGIGTKTVDGSALLELSSTNKGFLPPRVALQSAADVSTIPSPATGLVVYNLGPALPAGLYVNIGTPASPSWIMNSSNAFWKTNGNSGTTPASNFLGTTDNTDLAFKTFAVNRMRLASYGFLGIATLTPQTPLDIRTGSQQYGFQHSDGSISLRSWLGPGSTNGSVQAAWFGTTSNHPLDLMTNNVYKIRVNTDGRIRFNPDFVSKRMISFLEVADNPHQFFGFGYDSGLLRYQVAGSANAHVFYAGTSASASAELMRITGTGQVAIGTATPQANTLLTVNGDATKSANGTTWAVFSDRRIKKDVRTFTDGLAQVLQIKPVFFKYNGKGGIKASTSDEVGIIAQEMQKVAPYTVKETEIKVDASEKGLLQFQKADALVYMLVNGMKEQQTLITAQQDRINKLEEELKTLKMLTSKKVVAKTPATNKTALSPASEKLKSK